MASTKPSQAHGREDPTFRNYDSAAAKRYLEHRRGYNQNIIDFVVEKHTSTGGKFDVLLDVGCGPGQATRALAPLFQHAIGADPGQSMIETARTVESTTKSGMPITFEICGAESLTGLQALNDLADNGNGRVDLITAATAAHWFDMPRFWGEAAKLLKPGGSVIIWGGSGYTCNPNTTPNAAKMHEFLTNFETVTLQPYALPGNILTQSLLKDLGMPWECAQKDRDPALGQLLDVFPETDFQRHEFNKDGYVEPEQQFFSGERRVTFEQIKATLGTASPVTRWREAHKEQLEKGEMEDVMDMAVRRMREIMEEVTDGRGRDWIDAGGALVILVVKKQK